METDNDNEKQDDVNRLFEFEEASETVYELQTHVESTNADEELCVKLLNLTSPKFMHQEQVLNTHVWNR